MTRLMKAAVYEGPGRLRVTRVAVPTVGPRDVLIKVRACGICGSDLHSFKAGSYVRPGQILGHEFVGELAEAGAEVAGLETGERVTGFSVQVCGQCFWCQRKQFTLCPQFFEHATGYGEPGALAEYVRIANARLGVNVHRIPAAIDDDSAATIEPVAVAALAIAEAGVLPGDKVVVLGAGMIGNACVQAARAAGAARVVVVEVSPVRLEAARRLGADAVFDARTGDALAWVKAEVGVGRYHFNEGGMADVVIEAAGAPATVQQSLEMVRGGGTVAFVGLPEQPALVDTTKIIHKAPRIVGVLGGDFAKAIALLASGQVRTRPLISHRFPLDEAPAAFATQLRGDEAIKVLVKV